MTRHIFGIQNLHNREGASMSLKATRVSAAELDKDTYLSMLPTTGLFCGFSGAMRDRLFACVEHRTLEAGETLVTIGQYDGFECYLVIAGALRQTIVSPSTGEMSLATLQAGDGAGFDVAFGESFDVAPSMGLEAAEETELLVFETASLMADISTDAAASLAVARYFARQVLATRCETVSEAASEQRVFAALFKLVTRDPADVSRHIIAEMPKHKALAEAAGVTDVEAAEAVAELLRQGIAKRDYPGLVILDYKMLHRLAMA